MVVKAKSNNNSLCKEIKTFWVRKATDHKRHILKEKTKSFFGVKQNDLFENERGKVYDEDVSG
jgi:hypothetical protein